MQAMFAVCNFHQLGIYERIVRARNGALVRVRFAVVLIEGNLRGRIISIEPFFELKAAKRQIAQPKCLALPSAKFRHTIPKYSRYEKAIVFPYKDLSFFISQLTRAPSLCRIF